MPFFFYDPTWLLLIPALIFALYAQYKVRSTYEYYSRVASARGLTGGEVARQLLHHNRLHEVEVEETSGWLSDHYDPRTRRLRLSSGIYRSRSIAALGVAAHEVGHAIQHGMGYLPLKIRHGLFPVANLGSTLALPLFFIGFLFSSPKLMDIGIILFSGAVLFQVVTLPVEFNASRRALYQLQAGGYLAGDEIHSARKVLNAAALTYVAATAVAVLHLIRLLLLRGSRD